MTLATQDQLFACVQVDSPALAQITANRRPFQKYFQPNQPVVQFANLGGDAVLVVPAPQASEGVYAQIGSFTRGAPQEQQHVFWQMIAQAALGRLNDTPFWLSTSGLGVHWLHARLDNRPKYYTYAPFRNPT